MSSLGTNDLAMGRYLDGRHAGEDTFPDLRSKRACFSFKEHISIKAKGEAEDHFRMEDLKLEVESKVKELLASKDKGVGDLQDAGFRVVGKYQDQGFQDDLDIGAGERAQLPFKVFLVDKVRSEMKDVIPKVGGGMRRDDIGVIRSASRRVVRKSRHSSKGGLAERRRLTPSRKMRISRRKYEVAMVEALQSQGLTVKARQRFSLGGTRFTVSFDTMEFMLARYGDNVMAAGNFKMGGECQDTDSLF